MDGPPHHRSRELDAPDSGPLPGDEISRVSNRLTRPLSPQEFHLLDTYAARVLDENRRVNLSSDRDRASIYRRHFGESLAILAALEVESLVASPVIDIGSGAGFPAIPIKIARPELRFTLVEGNGKKARFLEAVVKELGLTDVRVIHARAEDMAHSEQLRASFRLALARAVAPLRELLELTLPFLSVDGILAAPKGSGVARELREAGKAMSVLGGEVVSAERLNLPAGGAALTLVVVRKAGETPVRYPRRAGIPHKRPL